MTTKAKKAEQPNPDELGQMWLEAKRKENEANAHRLQVETLICKTLGVKDEGSNTTRASFCKITTTGVITRKIDTKGALALRDDIGETFAKRLIKWVPQVVVSELKYLLNNEPEIAKKAQKRITSKPGKPQVKVERIE